MYHGVLMWFPLPGVKICSSGEKRLDKLPNSNYILLSISCIFMLASKEANANEDVR